MSRTPVIFQQLPLLTNTYSWILKFSGLTTHRPTCSAMSRYELLQWNSTVAQIPIITTAHALHAAKTFKQSCVFKEISFKKEICLKNPPVAVTLSRKKTSLAYRLPIIRSSNRNGRQLTWLAANICNRSKLQLKDGNETHSRQTSGNRSISWGYHARNASQLTCTTSRCSSPCKKPSDLKLIPCVKFCMATKLN